MRKTLKSLSLVMVFCLMATFFPMLGRNNPFTAYAANIDTITKDGFTLTRNGLLIRYTGSGGDVVIPDGVTAIGGNAFLGKTNVTSITIPSTVTSIGNYAFKNCSSLTTLTIPKSVTTIGKDVFDGCTSLTAIYVESGSSKFATFYGVLYNVDYSKVIRYPEGRQDTSYNIPLATTIGD